MITLFETVARAANGGIAVYDKRDAWAVLRDRLKETAEGVYPAFTEDELAILYKALAPKAPAAKKGAFDFKWVAKAAGKKDRRPYLNFVYSDGKRLIATDGARLHCIKRTGLPAGYYWPKDGAACPSETAKYPDIDRVKPIGAFVIEIADIATLPIVESGFPHKDVRFAYDLPSGHRIAKKYLDEALNGRAFFKYSYDDADHGSILIEDDDTWVVIMPMKKGKP